MFSPEELSVMRQGLDLITINGASAKQMAALQVKIEEAIDKELKKRDEELAQIINK